MSPAATHTMQRVGRWSAVVGVIALAGCAIGAAVMPERFFHGYLFAVMSWLGVPLGAMGILMTHHLTGGRWGGSIRHLLESAVLTLPIGALLFVPVIFGLSVLYPWAMPEWVSESEVLTHRQHYMNAPMFVTRGVVYFVLWIVGGYWLVRWSTRARGGTGARDERDEIDRWRVRLQRFAAVGLMVYVLTISFAVIDWIVSLHAVWYSSVIGIYLMIAQVLSAFAWAVVMGMLAQRDHPRIATPVLHDLGNLLLMLVVLHAYLAFSQFFVTWNSNLPAKVAWYVPRVHGAWGAVAATLMVLHFALPFVALLMRQVKRDARLLLTVAVVVLVARVMETAWMILPARQPADIAMPLWAIVAWLGVGGIWLASFVWWWGRRDEGPVNPFEPTERDA